MIPSVYQELPVESTFSKRFVQGVSDLIGLVVCFVAFIIIYLTLVLYFILYILYQYNFITLILFIRVLVYFIIHVI
jgi:hypothetical protein